MKKAVIDLSLLSLNIGGHTLKVKGTGEGYGDSLNSKTGAYGVLATLFPPSIALEGDMAMGLIRPSDAEKIALYIDGVAMAESESASFDLFSFSLSEGIHNVTMRARDAGYNKDDASLLYAVGYNESPDSNVVKYMVYEGTPGVGYSPSQDRTYYTCSSIGSATSITDIKIASRFSSPPVPVKGIKNNAFQENTVLQSVEIPSSILTIGDYAFYKCTNLRNLTISEGVQSIGEYAFQQCGEKNIVIPSSVKTIGKYAFYLGAVLTITLSSGLEVIGEGAFATLPSLKSIKIPATVTSIGKWGFNGCTQLATIEYEGTKSQWNAITKGTEWNSNVPATQVVCSDGTANL